MAHYIKEQSLYTVHKKIMHINFSSADEKVFKLPTNKRNAKKKSQKLTKKSICRTVEKRYFHNLLAKM